ncbi:uncharacterized protein LOC126674803 [Mercurialis annua]|uniref:uncharacterized protein LOC126674803 n=1 Tax=Mercurialis annua TaxID=3986 RepID=UPI00215DD5A5|nr:uncharacterized protein LOC126674803 [Mercurialis annua]
MNQCAIQTSVFSTREELRSSVSGTMSEWRDPVVCPKPRRLGIFNSSCINDNHPVRSLRWHLSHQAEICEAKAGNDLLDIILTKGGCYGVEQSCTQVASSPPPFFSGSPPSRVANPLIQDARFRDEELSPISTLMPMMPVQPQSSSSPSSSGRKGGCVRANFGNKPAVRVEGFDCLDRDRRNCSIPALA